jgi:cysteine synthase A
MNYANIITDLVGKTPFLKIKSPNGHEGHLLAKLESQNPGGSVKDRLALAMIKHGEELRKINTKTTIIEPTSGNTGIGLAMICAAKKYKLIVTMPESVSIERRNLIKAYGAEVVLTAANEGMNGSIKKALEIHNQYPNSYIPFQFKNEANAKMHRETTGPEIWDDSDGKVDVFIAGVGTGGTVTGTGEFLKSKNPKVKVVAVEPMSSPVISGGEPGKHAIQGIGAGFIPDVLNTKVLDEIIQVSDEDAFAGAKKLVLDNAVLAGISTGAIYHAAVQLAMRPENKNKNIVFIVCDTGERYLSTALYSND